MINNVRSGGGILSRYQHCDPPLWRLTESMESSPASHPGVARSSSSTIPHSRLRGEEEFLSLVERQAVNTAEKTRGAATEAILAMKAKASEGTLTGRCRCPSLS
jgi:hypothetical protein